MLCATLGGLAYGTYATHVLPVAIFGLAVNHGLLLWFFRTDLRKSALLPRPADSAGPASPGGFRVGGAGTFTLAVLVATVIAYFSGADLAFTAVAGFTALLVVHRADPARFWARIDWSVLLFFAGLFVVVEAFVRSGAAGFLLRQFPVFTGTGTAADYARTAGIFLVGSNLVSNVPFILVVKNEMARLPHPTLGWELLAVASTFAGNLTLLGSVANIIVAERGRSVGGLAFWPYLRVGVPLALATTAAGTAWLVFVHGVGW
jgi:Na+/H+ antiporter NhaD/arsenite permease-like protein